MLKKVEVKCNNHIMEDILDYFSVAQNQRKEKILLGFGNQIDGKYIINKVFYLPSFGNEKLCSVQYFTTSKIFKMVYN